MIAQAMPRLEDVELEAEPAIAYLDLAAIANPLGLYWADIVSYSGVIEKRAIVEVYGDIPFLNVRCASESYLVPSKVRFICRVPAAEQVVAAGLVD